VTGGVLVLAGATGSGKTELAIALARTFDAEIVGADSRQIYRGMPIGTALPTPAQRAAVPHHLIDFLDPSETYSAARYVDGAMQAIAEIRARGRRAIVAGGTGFYVRALLGGVALAPQYDASLRDRLAIEAKLHPPEFLHGWLGRRNPQRASALAPGDTYRVLRALEIALATGTHPERERPVRNLATQGERTLLIFLDVPLKELDANIARRAERMLDAGLVEEAERVGGSAIAANAVGYPQALAYLRGWCTHAELQALLVRGTRRYARRQRAWFRGERDALWLPAERVAQAVREKLGWSAKAVG
jgi:tRNA dimethylallyltransferase